MYFVILGSRESSSEGEADDDIDIDSGDVPLNILAGKDDRHTNSDDFPLPNWRSRNSQVYPLPQGPVPRIKKKDTIIAQ